MSGALLTTSCPHLVRAFGALTFAMSTDETRLPYYGINVTIDSMRVMFEATNGHVFARWMIHSELGAMVDVDRATCAPNFTFSGEHAQFIIPALAVRKALHLARMWRGPVIEIDENEIRVPGEPARTVGWETPMYPASERAPKRVEFPYSLRIWPDLSRKPSQSVSISTEYAIAAAQAFKHAYVKRKKEKRGNAPPAWPAVFVNTGGDMEPVVFSSHDVPAFTFLVMPCRK